MASEKKEYGFLDGSIKLADKYAEFLRESAKKEHYKNAMRSFFPSTTSIEAIIDCQQTIFNEALLYGASNTDSYVEYLKSLSNEVKARKQK